MISSLKSACWDIVPALTQQELIQFQKENAGQNLYFAGELGRLFDAFEQERIAIVAFKGVVLAGQIYDDVTLRECSDLDILVHEEDEARAERILASAGYKPAVADRNFRSAFLDYHGQHSFFSTRTGITIDLHWRLSGRSTVYPFESAFWRGLAPVTIGRREIATFAPADLALFLAAHGTKEGWARLKWVSDFARLLSTQHDLDWGEIFERARRFGCLRALLLAVKSANELLNAPAPLELLSMAQNDPAVRSLANDVRQTMLRAGPCDELAEFVRGLEAQDKFSSRLARVAAFLTTRTVGDHEAMPLPRPLWGLYYVTRPFRLALKGSRIAVRTTRAWLERGRS